MVASISCRVYTGVGAGNESPAQSAITLVATDSLGGPAVAPGSVSYERWLRLRLDAAPTTGVANFWFLNVGDLPAGVSILFGVTDTPATPVNTPSTIAKKVLASGQRYIFDTSTLAVVGQHSRYIVLQEVVASTAASGAIPQQALQWGWVER
jgi:hypothetical protein